MSAWQPLVPTGAILPWGGTEQGGAPGGFILCAGGTVSRTTYAGLFKVLNPNLGSVTLTIASPCVLTYSGTAFNTGDAVYLTTTGALPTGLSANTTYYIALDSGTSYYLSTSRANAYAGTHINTSGSQSGTHTLFGSPYGLGDGSTTFGIPDMRAKVPAGNDDGVGYLSLAQSQGSYGNQGATGGEQGHTLTSPAELPSHTHTVGLDATNRLPPVVTGGSILDSTFGTSYVTGATGSSGAHNNVQPTIVVTYIIKT
jgi:microcystin-dependent protein